MSSKLSKLSKLREALLKADVLISIATFEEGVKMDEVGKIRSEIKAAFAEPLRNCDVGSLDEQISRFNAFCESHMCNSSLGRCPLADSRSCRLAWSQMPYESEVNNGKA